MWIENLSSTRRVLVRAAVFSEQQERKRVDLLFLSALGYSWRKEERKNDAGRDDEQQTKWPIWLEEVSREAAVVSGTLFKRRARAGGVSSLDLGMLLAASAEQ